MTDKQKEITEKLNRKPVTEIVCSVILMVYVITLVIESVLKNEMFFKSENSLRYFTYFQITELAIGLIFFVFLLIKRKSIISKGTVIFDAVVVIVLMVFSGISLNSYISDKKNGTVKAENVDYFVSVSSSSKLYSLHFVHDDKPIMISISRDQQKKLEEENPVDKNSDNIYKYQNYTGDPHKYKITVEYYPKTRTITNVYVEK